MNDFEYTEKNLYDLLFILCDMLSSENISSHEEIVCGFIKTIELEGKPLKPFIKIMMKHKHLRSTLKNTALNISYGSQKKILGIMSEAWPEDIDVINRLQHVAYMLHLGAKNNTPLPHMSGKLLIQNLLGDG